MPTIPVLLLIYQCCIALALLGMAAMTLYNLRRLTKVPLRTSTLANAPFVSVLVPARNEERSIRACVESLLRQAYEHCEVVVLNDNSTDATGDILHDLLVQFPHRLRIINGAELPEGWVGKNWACHQLYEAAGGNILLFTDADTVHKPEMLASTIALMNERSLGCLSVIPHEIMDTTAERMILPFVHISFLAYFPIGAIMTEARLPVGAANGQFMMFRRDIYDHIGGHKALKNNIVEDIFFARRLKSFGHSVFVADASHLVDCRMYTSFSEVFAGFSKNLYPAMSARPAVLALYLLMNTSLFAAPLVFLLAAIASGFYTPAFFFLPLVQLLLAAGIRLMIARRFRMPLVQCLFHPPAALLNMAITINSVLWYYSPSGMQWKGRQYKKT